MPTDKPLRIAQIVGNTTLGGVAQCVLNYYRHIDRSKVQFDFFSYGPSYLDDEIIKLGGRVYYLPNFINFPKAIKELTPILRRNKYQIVHSHLTTLSVFPLFAAKRAGVPVRIVHAHSTAGVIGGHAIVKRILKQFASIYATHKLACARYSGQWLYGKNSDYTILYNAIDLDKFTYDAAQRERIRKKYKIDGILVGFAGRMCYQKNLFFLLDAFEEMLTVRPDAKLMLVGDGEDRPELEKQVAKKGLRKKVIFTGQVKDMAQYYNAFDVFVLPSHYEGLPLVGVEAQACGVPCVFSDKITGEVDIVHGVNMFMPISKKSMWAGSMAAVKEGIDRTGRKPVLAARNFDIALESGKLEKFYIDCAQSVEDKDGGAK